MPDATITSTASTFGTISGTFAADQSTITGTISGVVDGTLSGSVGVPGPQGDAGPTGPQGPAGEGVPAGGDAGYVLTKVDATDYNTVFAPIDLSSVRALTDYDFTNVADTKLAAFGLTLTPSVGTTIPYDSRLDADYLKLSHDETEGGTVSGNQYIGYYYQSSLNLLQRTYDSTGETYSDIYGVSLDGLAGVKFINWNYTQAAGTMQYGRTGITFGNGSVQTIAFPGFANAALTGNPTAPTPAVDTSTTQIATTAYVVGQGYLKTATAASTYAPIATGMPSAGSTGQVLAKSSGTNYDTAWTTIVPGDRYLTTSTTSLSVGNGSKTLTVGTGLSYSTQQDVVIAYNASNHMHATVTSYVSGTGVMVVDVQNHTGSGTYASWTVNVGGTTPLQSLAWGNITGTLSAQTDLQSALDAKSPLASPTFTGTPSLPTGTTAVTQAAGNNTTAVATTAFVQQEVPAASTTAAGKVELATDAETATGTDTARGVTPSSWYWSQHATNLWNVNNVTYGGATSGAGASAAASAGGYVVTAPTTAVGNATGSFIVPALQRGINRGSGAFNWSKKLSFSFRISRNNASTDSNTIWRATLGKASAAVGDLAVRGVGAKMAGNGALQLMVHNGTTLTTVTTSSSVVPTQSIVYDIRIMSDGAGNVTMYVDDVLEASTASGPTGTGSSGQSYYVTESENAAIISTTAMSMSVYNLRIDFNP